MPTRTEPARAPWHLLPIVLLGNFLAVLDFFVVNVALPSIGHDLGAGPATLELLVGGYASTYACGLVTAGRLGDALGRRRFFVGGMLAFTVASAGCGLAPTALVLVVARFAQGAAASVMVPQVLATVQALFTGADRQRALGVFGAVIGLATVLGQVVGAAFVAADVAGLDWRSVFLVNVPLGLAGAIAAARAMPDVRSGGRARLDLPGAVLLAVTLLAWLLPLSLGRDLGWPPWCVAVLGLAAVAAAALAVVEVRTERAGGLPLLPPSLLSVPAIRAGLPAEALFFVAAGGFLFTIAVVVQDGLGAGPMGAGLTLAPYGVAFLLMSVTVRRLTQLSGRRVIVAGAGLSALGMVAVAVQAALDFPALTPPLLAPAMAASGIGQSMVMIPLFSVILGGVPAQRAGLASGVLTTAQQASLGIGAAAFGTMLFTVAGAAPTADTWRAAAVLTFLTCAVLFAGAAGAAWLLPAPSPAERPAHGHDRPRMNGGGTGPRRPAGI